MYLHAKTKTNTKHTQKHTQKPGTDLFEKSTHRRRPEDLIIGQNAPAHTLTHTHTHTHTQAGHMLCAKANHRRRVRSLNCRISSF